MIAPNELELAGKRYQAWVNNKVQALTLTIQVNRVHNSQIFLKHEFFLEEMGHHFMDSHAGYKVWRAFRYLKRYLKTYPHGKAKHQETALTMLGLIYNRLGFDEKKILPAEYGYPKKNVMDKNNIHERAVLAVAV